MRIVLFCLFCTIANTAYCQSWNRQYTDTSVRGFPAKIDQRLPGDVVAATLSSLAYEIDAAASLLPKDAMYKIGNVTIWVEQETLNDVPIQYHYSRDWLRENGYNPDKESSIEIVAKDFPTVIRREPYSLLYPLAAAFGHQAGAPSKLLLAAFGNAVTNALFTFKRAEDYFSSLSTEYFQIRHSQYLLRRLKEYDSLGVEMVRATWGLQ